MNASVGWRRQEWNSRQVVLGGPVWQPAVIRVPPRWRKPDFQVELAGQYFTSHGVCISRSHVLPSPPPCTRLSSVEWGLRAREYEFNVNGIGTKSQ